MAMHFGHIAFRTPDPERSAAFLQKILMINRRLETDGAIYLTSNEKHHEVAFLPGETAGVDHFGLEVESDADLDRYRAACAAAGQTIVSETVDEPGIAGRAFRTTTPIGAVFEIYTRMERDPLSIDNYMPPIARRLGHVSFGSPRADAMESFLLDVLDFRVTDRLFDRRWLRCDPDHHSVALFESEREFIHHYAWMLEDFSQIKTYCDHLGRVDVPLVWGPGRHGPGRNIYTYLPDHNNVIVEGYSDLLQVIDEDNYEAMDWTSAGHKTLNLWGPGPPEGWRDFGVPFLEPEGVPMHAGTEAH